MARAVALVPALLAVCAPMWGACEHSATSLRRGVRGSEGDEARLGDFERTHEKDMKHSATHEKDMKRSANDIKSRDMDSDSEDQEEASDVDFDDMTTILQAYMKPILQAKGVDVLPSGGFQLDERYVAYPGVKRCPTAQHIENETECAEAVEAFSRKARELLKDAGVPRELLPDSVTSVLKEVTRVKASLQGDEKPQCIGSADGVKLDIAMTICKPCDESMTSAMVSFDEMNAEKSAASGRQPNTRETSPDRSGAPKRFLDYNTWPMPGYYEKLPGSPRRE